MSHGIIAVLFAAACALGAGSTPAYAQAFPTRPITFIVPCSVGGTYDVQLRALAAATEKHLGQPIVIENRSSPTGTLGPAQVAATAKPDGYTITQIGTSVLRLPYIAKTTYDPATDFTYIIGISGLTAGVVVRSDARWKTFEESSCACEDKPRQGHLRSARWRFQPGDRHAADRKAARHPMDPRSVQEFCRIQHVAFGRPYPGRLRRRRVGALREFRPTSAAGDLRFNAHQELAGRAGIDRTWHRRRR